MQILSHITVQHCNQTILVLILDHPQKKLPIVTISVLKQDNQSQDKKGNIYDDPKVSSWATLGVYFP